MPDSSSFIFKTNTVGTSPRQPQAPAFDIHASADGSMYPVKTINLWTNDDAIRGLSFTFGKDETVYMLGVQDGAKGTFTFQEGEFVRTASLGHNTHYAYVASIHLETSHGRTFAWGDGQWPHVPLGNGQPVNGMLLGFFGQAAQNVDVLGLVFSQPIKSIALSDITITSQNSTPGVPFELDTIDVTNDSDTDQTSTVTSSKSVTDQTSMSWQESLHIGIEVVAEVTPLGVGGRVTMKEDSTTTFNWGETKSTSRSFAATTSVRVPPHSRILAKALVTQQTVTATYAATATLTFMDATMPPQVIPGFSSKYNGVVNYDDKITYTEPTPIGPSPDTTAAGGTDLAPATPSDTTAAGGTDQASEASTDSAPAGSTDQVPETPADATPAANTDSGT